MNANHPATTACFVRRNLPSADGVTGVAVAQYGLGWRAWPVLAMPQIALTCFEAIQPRQRLLTLGGARGSGHSPQRLSIVLGAVMLALALPSAAQPVPDAGSLLQQIERDRTPVVPPARRPDAAPVPEFKPSGSLSVTVQRFEFRGHRLLGEAALQAAVAPWLARPLDFADLQRAVAAAAQAYRDAGWVVRAYLPQQEINGGTVTIQIVEALLGAVQLDAVPGLRLDPERARRTVLAVQPLGAPLNATAVDRALLLLQDLPGINVKGNLAAGQQDGQTDLLLRLGSQSVLAGEALLDNAGSRATGASRLSVNLLSRSALGLGDLGTASLIHAEGSDYLRLAASLPVGDRGLRAGLSASALRYQVISAAFASLALDGRSDTLGLNLSYPVLRSTARNLYANLGVDQVRYDNRSVGVSTSDYRVRSAQLGLSGSQFDEWGGGGLTSASMTLVLGRVDLAGSPNQASDAAGARTDGSYRKLRYSIARQQSLGGRLSLGLNFSGQLANRNLESGERFFLGGAQGVRAYPASEAGGAEGQLLSIGLRFRVRDDLSAEAFYDRGQIKVNRNNNFPGAASLNRYALHGVGTSLAWFSPWGVNLTAAWSRRLGSNANATASGRDQDGTLNHNRFWLTASYAF